MASSYVDPAARDEGERSRGAYSGGWMGARSPNAGGASRDEGGDASFGGGDGGDSEGRRGEQFVPNEDLGEQATVRMVHAPADADAIEWSAHGGGPCFACAFVKKKDDKDGDPFNEMDAKDAYDDMMRLIQDNYARMSNPELVRLVHAFYQREIRPLGFGEWTPASISRHVLFHTQDEDVLMQEATNILYSQIQSLRSRTWVENTLDQTLEPIHKNILTMERLIRSLGDHLTKKKTRKNS